MVKFTKNENLQGEKLSIFSGALSEIPGNNANHDRIRPTIVIQARLSIQTIERPNKRHKPLERTIDGTRSILGVKDDESVSKKRVRGVESKLEG